MTNPAAKRITYAYDAAGQRSHMIDADGGRFTYGYDAVGQTDHLVNSQAERTSYAYDPHPPPGLPWMPPIDQLPKPPYHLPVPK